MAKGIHKNKQGSGDQKSTAASSAPSFSIRTLALPALLLTVAVLFTFSPAFDNEFVNWDDQAYVEEQPMVLEKAYGKLLVTPVSLNYHPVTMISLAAQAPEKGEPLKAAPFIRANIALHLMNSLLVLLLAWLLSGRQLAVSVFTAAVFALHPLHVESVVWVSERKDVLYTFFFLAACIAYWKHLLQPEKRWLLLAFFLFLLSVLSKAMAVVLPVVFLLLDYWHNRPMLRPAVWLPKIPFFAVSLFFGLMAMNVQGGGDFYGMLTLYGEKVNALAAPDTFTLLQRMQFASYGFVSYFGQFFYPYTICAFYPYPDPSTLTGGGGMVFPALALGIITGAVLLSKKYRVALFGIGFYLVTVALVLQFISVGLAIKADRYTYIPYIGIAFLLSTAVYRFVTKRVRTFEWAAVMAAVVFVLSLMIKTRAQSNIWQNSEMLWTQVLEYFPAEDLALANRGNYRGKTGNIDGAFSDFQQAIADGCRRADVYEGLGNCYGTMSEQQPGQKQALVQKAIEAYQKGLEIEPNRGNIHFNLGVAQLGSNPKASAQSYKKALEIMPYKEKEILPPLGLALLNSGAYEEAVNTLSKAMELNGPNENTLYQRGLAFIGLSRPVEARKDLQAVLAINPSQPEVPSKLQYLNEKFGGG